MNSINHNILVAPQFPDGEIVNGFLIRAMSFSGSWSLALACRRLMSRRHGLDGMPSSLCKFHDAFGHLYGDISVLIDKHTEYHFFCCGLPRFRFADQRQRLMGMYRGPVRLCRLPLLFNKSENSYLQCPECEAQQKKELGFAFIHRRMGAPFVNVCPMHGVDLRPRGGCLHLFDARCQSTPTQHQRAMTMELGKRTDHCMEIPAEHSKYHKDDVVQQLKDSNWIGSEGRCRLTQFKAEFIKFFADAFSDERLRLMTQSEKFVEIAIRALLSPNKGLHPDWCVLFKWFAEEQSHTSASHAVAAVAATSARELKAGPLQPLLRTELEGALKVHGTIRTTAKALGISVPLLSAYCKRSEVCVNWRPKTLTAQRSAEIAKALREGMALNEAAVKFSISTSSIYRILSASGEPIPRIRAKMLRVDADKQEWTTLVRANPGFSRNALRRLRPQLWMRLYRNDKDWLAGTLPPPVPPTNGVRVGPHGQLVANLNSALADAANVCTSLDKRVHKSHYRLQKLTGVTAYALKTCETNGLVEKQEEPRINFAKARLDRVLKATGRPVLRPAVIAKEVNLRTDTVRKALKT